MSKAQQEQLGAAAAAAIRHGTALDGRPLVTRLKSRADKYQGASTQPLVTDIALHAQSAEAITRLVEALEYCDQSGELPSPDVLALARALVIGK